MTLPANASRFRVALSFPGEHRKRVETIAEALAKKLGQEKVLYDQWYRAELTHQNLDLYLEKLYRDESQLVVFFFCEAYKKKPWCGVEWRVGRELRMRGEGDRVMCLRFDQVEIPGLSMIDGCLDISTMSDSEVSDQILKRLDLLAPSPNGARQYRTFTSKLPTVNTTLIGRDEQIAFLDRAWANPATNFVQIIAPGGTGKTALMDKWFRRHLGEATVFGWSFYSQGTSEHRATSSDTFFAEIMNWLSIDLPPSASVYARAEAVANRLREERMLLILDGIEPMQDSTGVLRDSALKALLQELSNANQGLVLCTTRVRLDIPDDAPRALSFDLENLTPEHGAKYLQHLGVQGEEKELQQASRDCGNHALALTLLGTYLVDFLEADIRRRVEIRELMIDELQYGAHARRMMVAYERMFKGKPEAAIMRSLGYFDRPAEPEALRLVLPTMKEREYQAVLNRLYQARLVLSKDPCIPVDCHPLIREHFAAVMRLTATEEFREGHSKLYEHYCQQAPHQPDTLDEMAPLFYAVYHGCQAGRHQEVRDEIYRGRILRGNTFYLWNVIGAFGIDLSLLTNFFENPWFRPVANLLPKNQTWVLSGAGYGLRALGRLSDALEPMRSAAERRVKEQDWRNAARNYGSLSELLLSLGQVQPAIAASRQSIDLADQSHEQFEQMSVRTILADAVFQSGDLVEAQRLFAEAERLQAERQPDYRILYSLHGFRYCDLLLEQGQTAEVIRRATESLRLAEARHWLLDIGLDHLSLGRAYSPGSPETVRHLNQAVDFMRQSGNLDDLPRALLARGSPADLDEVFRIATRSGMKLHLTDYHLVSARLAIANHDLAKAHEHIQQAESLIKETGYHRRDRVSVELHAAVESGRFDG
jgi:tetratricopeptide (TPR) repeat protein